jgi:hypothetical protein
VDATQHMPSAIHAKGAGFQAFIIYDDDNEVYRNSMNPNKGLSCVV